MHYKKITSAVLCFFFLSSAGAFAFLIDDNISLRLQMMPMLKSFLEVLVAQYPLKTFALCVTEDYLPVVVDAAYLQAAPAVDEHVTRTASDAFSQSHEEIVVSAEAAVIVPLTAFHAANMSAQSGWSELPRPARVVIQPRVFSRPQEQQSSGTPQGHLRPSVPSSPWRSVSDSAVLFWIFATVLPRV